MPLDPNTSDFQEELTKVLDKFESLLDEVRSMGYTGVLMIGAYDELERVPHNQWRTFGNPVTVLGQVEDYKCGYAARISFESTEDEDAGE